LFFLRPSKKEPRRNVLLSNDGSKGEQIMDYKELFENLIDLGCALALIALFTFIIIAIT
jgi:hypothetical protein